MRAFIFPGQGSQAVGMGKLLAEDHFVQLLRAEGLASLPQPIADRLGMSEA